MLKLSVALANKKMTAGGSDEVMLQEMPATTTRSFGEEGNEPSSKEKSDITSKKFLQLAGLFAIVGCVVLVVILPVYFEVIVPNQQGDDEIVVPVVPPESDRFDCMPDGNANQQECEARGCIWSPPVSNSDAPSCFYSDKDGYKMSGNPVSTTHGYQVSLLSSNRAAPFGEDFDKLRVDVTRVTDEKLRITISPESEKRFEVPWEHESPSDSTTEVSALYGVQFVSTAGGLFGIRVTRKSTGKILFDSSVGRLSFSDQYLQISTKVASDFVYGFGEHMHESFKHNMQWKTYGMFSRDQGVGTNANLYGVHPFHLCMEGDGNAHAVLLLNSNAQDVTLQPMPALTYRTVGGLMDFYIFVGPNPEHVISQYTETIGRPYMPPYWSLGFQLSRYGYGSLDKLKKVVDRNLAANIPYDIQYSDIDYMDRQLDFTINETTYMGLGDFVLDLKNTHSMKYIIILDPAISGNETEGSYPPFDLGKERGVFIAKQSGEIAFGKVWPDVPGIYINTSWDWDSQTAAFRAHAAFPDFLKQATKDWWHELIVDFYQRIQFDGLWIDMNEPASFVHGSVDGCPSTKYDNPLRYHPHILGSDLYEKTTCMSHRQYNPATDRSDELHYNMHSLYGWSQALPTLDACRAATGERCMIISRSTFPGSGKYLGHWLGDNTSAWEHLRASIIGMLEFNLFGIPYIGADICGFFQDSEEELCMRWMQLGAFYPFSRNHNGLGFKDQDPAAFGSEFAAASKKILEVRYRVLPYFYTLFYEAHVSGSTVIRSLMAEFPDDLATYEIDEQFLLGGHLLISPVLYPQRHDVEAYVPDSRWFDYYTGAELATGLRKTRTFFYAPWDHMPLHIRGGSIIPVQTAARTTELQRRNGLGLMYAMGDTNTGSGRLFWDDGNSIDTIENGQYILLTFSGTKDELHSHVEHDGYPDGASMVFDHATIMGVVSEKIVRVLVDGAKHDNYTFDATTKVLSIHGLSLPLNSDWQIMWDANQHSARFDCHPDGAATQQKCESRGCIWDPVQMYGVPACYYPPDYGMYKKDTAPESTDKGEVLYLERWGKPTFFRDPVQRLKFDVEMQSEHQIRIKISDPNADRYEVPLSVGGTKSGPVVEPLYEVIYQDEPFGFKLVRRATREVLMDTSVGALVYEDQFLEISTRAVSQFMYGLGEHEHPSYAHDFFWKRHAMFAYDQGVRQDANLYGHHPFHMTMEPSGNAHGVLLLSSNAMEVSLTPLPAITYRTIGGVLDFYIFLGPTPEHVTQQYLQAVGLPMMPPYWSLGFQLCKYGYGDITELKKVVEGMRDYDIPFDVQYGDIDYMDRQLDFTISGDRYAGLPEYVDQMRDEYKMRYVVILDPAISANETESYPPYDDGMTEDVFIRGHDGGIMYGMVWPDVPGTLYNESTYDTRAHVAYPDFFKPATKQWWTDNVLRFYNDIAKFDGLWIDMNEPANFYNGQRDVGCPMDNTYDHPPYLPDLVGDSLYSKSVCMSSVQYSETTPTHQEKHYNVHSLYGWSQAEPTLQACRQATGKRCYVISRSTFPGAGKFTGHWLGDNTSKWPHLKASIIGMMEFNLFGFPYVGADICGFFEDAEEEMCMRWSQLGAFYPFSRNHAMLDVRRQDPAAWGPEFAASVRKVLLTRYTLLPYLYTLFYHAHTEGSTVVRPLLHEFPNDKITWNIDEQMLWGPALLISPVLEAGKQAVEAYFPEGRWFDYYSGSEVPVTTSFYQLPAPKDHINLHVRGGYILPTQEPANTTYFSRQNQFGLIVALDNDYKATSGDLFWDDGEAKDVITSKRFTHSTFTCEGNVLENRIVHDGYAESNSMILSTVTILGLRDDVTQLFLRDSLLNEKNYEQDSVSKRVTIRDLSLPLNEEFMIRWEINNEWSRFDCMPDLQKDTNRADCEARGCVWQSSTTPSVPFCFYSKDAVHGYDVTSSSVGSGTMTYDLQRRDTPTMYGDDIEQIRLKVEYQTNNRLHFKLDDPINARYEVPQQALTLPSEVTSSESTANYAVTVNEKPFSIQVRHKANGLNLFDSSVGSLSFADQFLQISTSLPHLNIYGFGEHNHKRYRHDLNWRRWSIFTRDVAPVDDWNLYGHHTFFMGAEPSVDGKSYGVYLHNSNAMDVVLQPTPALTYRITGGVLDFYLFVGNSPEEVVREYHQLIGLPALPPYWGLGFQLSRWGYGPLVNVETIVQEMRDAKIPFDIQYGDIDYMDQTKSFTYDHENYANLPQFVDNLHQWGMRYVIILDPGIKIEPGYKAYDEGINSNIFITTPDGITPLVTEVWPGETHHPDYLNPAAADWWYEQCREFYSEQHVHYDALWIDMNEPANFQPDDPAKLAAMNCTGKYNFPKYMPRILGYWVGLHDKTFCMDNMQSGEMHYNVHSLYGHTMTIATHSTLERVFPYKRSFLFSRSTFAGSGKYGGHWTGDNQSRWPQLAASIPIMFEFNLFGFPYVGADICGFWFNTTEELCQRWMQVGAFYPFSRNHNAAGMNAQHPTAFSDALVDSSRDALNIRYTILPYMYTQMRGINTHGGTLVRALAHEFPSDKSTWNIDRQFLLGSAFMVTPVLDEGKTEVTAYFPHASRWFDYRTGKEMAAGKFWSLEAPMDYINLHVRGGYVMPLQDPAVTTEASRQNNMSLLVALDASGNANGQLYWDDGEARNVAENFLELSFVCSGANLRIQVAHSPADLQETSNLYIHMIKVYGVDLEITGVSIDQVSMTDNFGYDSSLGTLEITKQMLSIIEDHTVSWS